MNTEYLELLNRLEDYTPDEATAFPFSARLARDNGWSPLYARRVIQEYKRFAFLAVAAGHPVTPSDQVDQAWHLHLLYTASYWKDFCGTVLRKPLHHGPTKGGGRERDKFCDWYNRTLESYRQFFNEEPPTDIWPDASRRFGQDIHFVRINATRNWIVPKPASFQALISLGALLRSMLAWRRGWTVAVMACGACAAGCASLNGDSASPFDLPGGDFIQLFFVSWVLSFGLAAWLRWALRQPTAEQGVEPVDDLDPYTVAYLSGHANLTVNAALANLVHVGALKAHSTEPRLLREGSLPAIAHPFERAIHEGVTPDSGSTIAEIREHARSLFPLLEERLKKLDLLVSRSQSVKVVLYPLLFALLAPAIGLIKIAVGLSRSEPVGFLIFLCLVSVVVALAGFLRRPQRSRRGDQVLAWLKTKHAALQSTWNSRPAAETSWALPMAIGLFGMTALASTPLAGLQKTLRTPSGGGGCGGGCGGGDGGGCGGCGGCGG